MGPVPGCQRTKQTKVDADGKVLAGCTLRLGTDTLALPPGVKSCDCTSSVTPRIRRELEFRSESDVCKSSSIAPPRGLKVDSPQSALITVTGESSGRVMCIVLRGSSRPLCGRRRAARYYRTDNGSEFYSEKTLLIVI